MARAERRRPARTSKTTPPSDDGDRGGGVIEQGAVPRHLATNLAHVGGADDADEGRGERATQEPSQQSSGRRPRKRLSRAGGGRGARWPRSVSGGPEGEPNAARRCRHGRGIANKPPQSMTIAAATVARIRRRTWVFTGRAPACAMRESSMRRPTSLELLHPGKCQGDKADEDRHQRRKSSKSNSHADSSGAAYQPLMNSLAIRRCPLLNGIEHNRHTPVTERSVALHAPRPA